MHKMKMNYKDLYRAHKIIKGICPVCERQWGYPDYAAECCEGVENEQ